MEQPRSVFMKTAYIGLGSNLGNSLQILRKAWRKLGQEPAIRPAALSNPYRTEPVAMASRHWFINAVACLQTSMPPRDLLHALLATEKKFGRTREGKAPGYQDRILDLDLLLYDDLVCQTATMTLPHPELHNRLFVLSPLCEIAPDCVHPLFKRTAMEMLTDHLAGARHHPVVQRISWQGNPQP